MADESEFIEHSIEMKLSAGVPECNKAFWDHLNNDDNKFYLDPDNGNKFDYHSLKYIGNIKDD
jgi:hypothetical protein